MEEDGREILEPYELHYCDLLSLSSLDTTEEEGEFERLEAVTRAVMEALGPDGPGLLAITGVPNVAKMRNTLLPLARDLSLVESDDRKRILKDHGLGSDVPLKNLDRCVSSFAMQLKYGSGPDLSYLRCGSPDGLDEPNPGVENFAADASSSFVANHFKGLSGSFRELGLCMMDLGLRLARICDRAIGGKELEQSLLESGTAKGRLIHYHSYLDTYMIKESRRRKGTKKGQSNSQPESFHCRDEKMSNRKSSEKFHDLWQQWHYDYGTFTVLTSPMFIRPISCQAEKGEKDGFANFCGLECPSPSGHTYLQIFHPSKKTICFVKAPPESFILQVGESADILSRRMLCSTLHSVSRPIELKNLSRETFVVFLHPAWNKVFDISDYPMEQLTANGQHGKYGERPQGDEQELMKLTQAIHKRIPPLSSRLRDGMTFAEFSRETTKQYYGGSGLQSNR